MISVPTNLLLPAPSLPGFRRPAREHTASADIFLRRTHA